MMKMVPFLLAPIGQNKSKRKALAIFFDAPPALILSQNPNKAYQGIYLAHEVKLSHAPFKKKLTKGDYWCYYNK